MGNGKDEGLEHHKTEAGEIFEKESVSKYDTAAFNATELLRARDMIRDLKNIEINADSPADVRSVHAEFLSPLRMVRGSMENSQATFVGHVLNDLAAYKVLLTKWRAAGEWEEPKNVFLGFQQHPWFNEDTKDFRYEFAQEDLGVDVSVKVLDRDHLVKLCDVITDYEEMVLDIVAGKEKKDHPWKGFIDQMSKRVGRLGWAIIKLMETY